MTELNRDLLDNQQEDLSKQCAKVVKVNKKRKHKRKFDYG